MQRKLVYFHPILFAVAPILLLAAANVDQLDDLGVLLKLCLVSLAATTIFVLLIWSVTRNIERAAILASIGIICFFSYGHLFEHLDSQDILETGQQIHWILISMIIAIGAVSLFLVVREKGPLPRVTKTFFIVSAVLVSLATFHLLQCLAAAPSGEGPSVVLRNSARPVEYPPPLTVERAELPDIYYIILDGYARQDVLQERFGFDNSDFVQTLEAKGFYVAHKSCSNYPLTYLSLASSLNMRHILKDAETIGQNDTVRQPIYSLIQDNEVARSLQQRGYRYLQINTNWTGTERSDIADVEYTALPPLLQKELTALLIRTTMLRELTPGVANIHRYALAQLKEIHHLEGPTFTFCHLILPHNPYVFDRDGNVTENVPLWLQFDVDGKMGGWSNREGYIEQLEFVNREVIKIVDCIVANSKVPPVIILQADHGSATLAGGGPPAENIGLIKERMPILNAYYVPEVCRKRLYPHVSPVNTFRILFNGLFGEENELLEDRQYISWYQRPYDLVDCTSTFEAERPPESMPPKSSPSE